jgi:adenylate cyclase
MAETRKLAAILAADVVGYSRLAGADEDRTLARLRALRSDHIDPIIAVHKGRVVKRTGDGSLVEFRSVVDAIRCAIEVQNGMVERNAGLPSERRIEFRIGIHLGDVVEEADGDLMGDGVNIAARLEGIAEPNGVCLSSAAYEQVRDKLRHEFVYLGEKELKNIARPMRVYSLSPAAIAASVDRSPETRPANTAVRRGYRWAYALAACVFLALAAGWFGWRRWSHSPTASAASDLLANAPRLSLVVLPFENLSGDPDQSYFADGITDDLTTDLSHLPDSFVIDRNTAFTFKGKAVDVKQIGRELGVRYALEGSVRRVDENITLNAQLISTETGAHVWADRFEGERAKLGQLQVEFVGRLASTLDVALVRAESLRAMRERPANPNAVDLAMRGWATIYKGYSIGNVTEALDDFERALQLEPGLVRAQVGLAQMLRDRITIFRAGDPAIDLDRADALIASALSADPNDAQAHYTRASLLFARKQFAGTLSELKDAIEINRNFAQAYAFYGFTHIFVGKAAETIPNIESALRLSPRDPFRSVWEANICHAHSHMAEWEKAVEWCEKSIATNAGYWTSHVDLVAANGWLQRDVAAKAAIAELLKLRPGFTVQSWATINWSDDPTFQREYQRITEGLRMAGLPEK